MNERRALSSAKDSMIADLEKEGAADSERQGLTGLTNDVESILDALKGALGIVTERLGQVYDKYETLTGKKLTIGASKIYDFLPEWREQLADGYLMSALNGT